MLVSFASALLLMGFGLVLVAFGFARSAPAALPLPVPDPAPSLSEPDEEDARTCQELIHAPGWWQIYTTLQEIGTHARLLADRYGPADLARLTLADGYRYDARKVAPSEARLIAHFGFTPPEPFVPWLRDIFFDQAMLFLWPSDVLARLQVRRDALEALLRHEKALVSGRRLIVPGSRSFTDRYVRLEWRIVGLRALICQNGLRRGAGKPVMDFYLSHVDASLRRLKVQRKRPDARAFAALKRLEADTDAFERDVQTALASSAASFVPLSGAS